MTTADGHALLQVVMEGHTKVVGPESRAMQKGKMVRAEITSQGSHTPGTRTAAGVEPSLAVLIAELVSAGLVSVEVGDDGDMGYALTPRGQLAARLMAMSPHAHALVLLGALVGAREEPN
jgi:hypothetical protein